MNSAVTPNRSSARPLVSIAIGALLLLFSLFLLLARYFFPSLIATYAGIPSITTLLLLIPGGVYLLACLVTNTSWRIWQQRGSAATIIAGSLLIFYWLKAGYTPGNITLSSPNALVALTLLGLAALLQGSVRSLTQLALVFLLILSAAALAFFGIIAQLLDYDPLFPWYGIHRMSELGAAGLLIFSAGLAYMIWWCHRINQYDAVGGITLLSSMLLLFVMVLGSGIIYTVSATHLHFEARDDLGDILSERTAHLESMLRQAESHAATLSYMATHQERGFLSQPFSRDISLRVSDSRHHVLFSHNAEWFERRSTVVIEGMHSHLWCSDNAQCQLRVAEQRDGYLIEIGVPLDLQSLFENSSGNNLRGSLKLCTQLPDDTLRCLSSSPGNISLLPPLDKKYYLHVVAVDDGHLYINENDILAVKPLPSHGLLAILEQNQHEIFGSLHKKLTLALPLALLLLVASVMLIIWRIHPLIRTLQRNEEQQRTLVDGAADAIFLHAPDRRFIRVNPAASKLLGYSHAELIGKHPDDFLLPDDQQDARDALARALKDRSIISARRLLRRKDGSLIPVEINATVLDNMELISVVRDIGAQVRFENEIREKERFIRSVIEVLAEGVVVQNSDGEIIYSNRTAQNILVMDESSTHERIDSLIPHWDATLEDGSPLSTAELPAMISMRQGVSKRDIILGVMRPDGNRVWLSVNSDPLWNDEHTNILGAVTSFIDITDKRAMEKEVLTSRERLRALSSHLLYVREEERSQIARDIHDELGSTLSAMKMGLEWLNEQCPEDKPDFKRRLLHLSVVTSQAIHSSRRMVTQLRPTVLEDLGLWAAIDWLVHDFQTHNDKITVSYSRQITETPPPIEISLPIYRVIQESLTNITKHAHAKNVRIECWYSGNMLHFNLEDDGIGITEFAAYKIDSYGIRGMYERIGHINGTMQILGTPGEGTIVSIAVPHQHNASDLL